MFILNKKVPKPSKTCMFCFRCFPAVFMPFSVHIPLPLGTCSVLGVGGPTYLLLDTAHLVPGRTASPEIWTDPDYDFLFCSFGKYCGMLEMRENMKKQGTSRKQRWPVVLLNWEAFEAKSYLNKVENLFVQRSSTIRVLINSVRCFTEFGLMTLQYKKLPNFRGRKNEFHQS